MSTALRMSHHLDRVQMRSLRGQLRERELAALVSIKTETARRAEQPYAELAGIAPDEGDAAMADLLVDIDHALIDQQLDELDDIRAARERIRRHLYGKCIDCKQPIGFDRLSAYPTAKRCMHCQRAYERTHATAPRATL